MISIRITVLEGVTCTQKVTNTFTINIAAQLNMHDFDIAITIVIPDGIYICHHLVDLRTHNDHCMHALIGPNNV